MYKTSGGIVNTIEYTRMAEREQTYWWHTGRLKIIDSWLNKWVNLPKNAEILNVGCGTGGTLAAIEQYGKVKNIDVSDEAIKFMKTRGYNVKKVNDHTLPYKDNSLDLVVAFDVLEHIEEHEAALAEWSRVLKSGGKILFTVPAYQWLWSEHDTSLHHHRRYTKELVKKIAPDQVQIQRMSYCIVFSLPLVVGFRFLNKILGRKADSETSYVNVPGFVNNTFDKFLSAESHLHKTITFPAGTSLICLMRKK